MKVLVCKTPGEFRYESRETPRPAAGKALIRIRRIGVCGTDLHAYEGTQPYFEYPRILGHELSGELVDYEGEDDTFHVGETVSFIPYFSCGQCVACRAGKPNCCVHIRVCGVHMDGGMAEYLSVPSSTLLHGEGLGFDQLALVEPLAIGAHSIRRGAVTPDETVLIIGAGPIGLGAMEFARLTGAKVIAMDVNEKRLSFCRDHIGVNHTIPVTAGSVSERLMEITGGDMPVVVIDATGNLKAINGAFDYLAHGGRYVLIGLQKGDITFSHPEFHRREATLMSSRNATREDFRQVIGALKRGWINPETYITHRVDFGEVRDQFPRWLSPDSGVIKAMVEIP